MHLAHEKQPLLLEKRLDVKGPIRVLAASGASKAEGTRKARIAQHFEDRTVLQGHPMQFAGMRTAANAAREEQRLCAKILDGSTG